MPVKAEFNTTVLALKIDKFELKADLDYTWTFRFVEAFLDRIRQALERAGEMSFYMRDMDNYQIVCRESEYLKQAAAIVRNIQKISQDSHYSLDSEEAIIDFHLVGACGRLFLIEFEMPHQVSVLPVGRPINVGAHLMGLLENYKLRTLFDEGLGRSQPAMFKKVDTVYLPGKSTPSEIYSISGL